MPETLELNLNQTQCLDKYGTLWGGRLVRGFVSTQISTSIKHFSEDYIPFKTQGEITIISPQSFLPRQKPPVL